MLSGERVDRLSDAEISMTAVTRNCATGVVFGLAVLVGGYAHAQDPCDKACLEAYVDDYLEALVAHDADRLPLAAGVKFTENGQQLDLNQALWATASKNADYRLYYSDPLTGQVGFYGLLEENDEPVILALRLRIRAGEISEIEHIVARLAVAGTGDVDGFISPRATIMEPLRPDERSSRSEMIAIANSYYSGLDELNTGRDVPFDANCQRIENGVETANSGDPEAAGMRAMGCAEQLNIGVSEFITDIRERRFPVVDEERGLVFTIIFYDHAGNVAMVELADGTTFNVSLAYQVPRTWMKGEIFKIRQGRIKEIEAVLVDVPYRMPSGW